MKKRTILIFTIAILMILINNKVYAGEQHWNSLNYDVKLNSDGSMDVVETWDILVSETNTLFKNFDVDESKYSSISNVKVVECINENEYNLTQIYEQQYHVDSGCYYAMILPSDSSKYEIAWNVGADNRELNKKYKIYYTVNDAVKVYNDCTEIYWQFLGVENEISGENISGTITLPEEVSDIEKLKVWAHGDLLGDINIISNDCAKFSLGSLLENTMLEVRIVTTENIYDKCNNEINENKLESILAEEKEFARTANRKKFFQKMKLTLIYMIFLAIFIYFLRKIANYKKEGKELEEKYKVSVEKIKYFRDIPNEKNATPARASYMYNYDGCSSKIDEANVFSATLLDLAAKKIIEFKPIDEHNMKINLTAKEDSDELSNLPDDEKFVYEFLQKACKKNNYTTLEEFAEYSQSCSSSFATCASKIFQKAEEYIEDESGNFDKSKKKVYQKWIEEGGGTFVYFIGMIIISLFIISAPLIFTMLAMLVIATSTIFNDKKKYPKMKVISYAGIVVLISIIILSIGNMNFTPYIIIGIICCIPIEIEIFIISIISKRNAKIVNTALADKGLEEQEQWRGLKNYLTDYSLLEDREVVEISLWEKYLVYATALGVSKKALNQLASLYPQDETENEIINNRLSRERKTNLIMPNFDFATSVNKLNSEFNRAYYIQKQAYSSGHSSSGSGGGGGFSSGGGGGRPDVEAVEDAKIMIDLKKEIQYIKGVGPTRAKLLNKIGINNLEDLITYFPREYEDRSKPKNIAEVENDEEVLISAYPVGRMNEIRIRGNLCLDKLIVRDETGTAQIVWYNQSYLKNVFKPNQRYKFYGKIKSNRGKIEMQSPVYEEETSEKNTGRIIPIYPLTYSLTQNTIRKIIESGLAEVDGNLPETMPKYFLDKYGLYDINTAIHQIHFPENFDNFEKARKRLVFEELLSMQLSLLSLKNKYGTTKKGIVFDENAKMSDVINDLPFNLTNAQLCVLKEIDNDMEIAKPMNRLLQGDVGSGKTIVAMIACYKAVKSGYQAVVMAPTAILATQHLESFTEILDKYGIKCELLVSGISKKKKEDILHRLENGEIDILIGTHAVLEENVKFSKLGLVVTDEQHRFGVRQRTIITEKGDNPDVLVMTATPIPRTLALILYGDLDISIIDELPPNRKKIETYAVTKGMETRVNAFIAKNIDEGRQCYIVCPLVEENDEIDAKSVMELVEEYKNHIFSQYKVEYLHGKMRPKEKDEIMERFKNGDIDILISTTVIEVGVNVPNSNIMVIENAERFGLAQLHQLRGRVGRGEYQSYCILKYQGKSDVVKQRMDVISKSNDGFVISEKDLELRGSGEFFGTKQHGIPEFKIANLFEDIGLLKTIQGIAIQIIDNDPLLEKAENKEFRRLIEKNLDRFTM